MNGSQTTLAVCLAIAGAGCNAILGNATHDYEPGDASQSLPGNDGAFVPDASSGPDATVGHDAGGTLDALGPLNDAASPSQADASPVSPGGDGDAAPVTCTTGLKVCGGQCVAIDNPAYGCGATTCDASTCPRSGAATLVCKQSACVISVCPSGTKTCGTQCVSLQDPKYGCAGTTCDQSTCPDAGAGSLACQNGACVVGTCSTGDKICGGHCVSTSDPVYGCGAMTCDSSSCPPKGTATLACQGGTCVIGSCGPGDKLCAGKCVSIDDPTYGCGATSCDATSCPAPGAGTLVCQSGACVVGACGAGTKKCGSQCVPLDANHGCGDTAVCTACASNQRCVGSPTSACACVPDNASACANMTCGTATNNCGTTVSCGACTQPDTCGGGGTAGVCGCKPIDPCGGGTKCGNNLQNGCGGGVTCQCLALPPDNMVTVCASGVCATQCAVSSFDCGDGTTACGSWDFASGISNWTVESGFPGNAFAGSIATTKNAPAGGGSALAVGYDSTPLGTGASTANLLIDSPLFCQSTNLTANGSTLSAQIYLSGPALPPNLGSLGVFAGHAGGGVVTQVVGQWISVGGPLNTLSFPSVTVSVALSDVWAGTIYIKNVQVK